MILIEALKNVLPMTVFIIGMVFSRIAKIIDGIATLLYSISVTLHMLLDTQNGKKLKELEKTTQSILNLYNNINKKIEAQKAAVSAEENKLAKIIKDDKTVVQLGKKKDDDPKG